MQDKQIHEVMDFLRNECKQWPTPSVTVVAERYRSAFTVLVSCIISLRTRDAVTAAASGRLFAVASTPAAMELLSVDKIEELIYPTGFYRNKARQIHEICISLMDEFAGVVPDKIEQLLTFKGVGRKTANLVLTMGYGKPGICVDIHVHRIVNRWGYVKTASPDKTETELRKKLPEEYWIEINDLLVCYGQNRCFPVGPACSLCGINRYCDRVAVARSR